MKILVPLEKGYKGICKSPLHCRGLIVQLCILVLHDAGISIVCVILVLVIECRLFSVKSLVIMNIYHICLLYRVEHMGSDVGRLFRVSI